MKILRGPWNDDLFRVLEGFPELAHDDEVDACSGALEMLNPNMNSWGIYELYRQQAEKLRAEREAWGQVAQSVQPTWAPGSMEWQAEQEKLKAEREKLTGGGSGGRGLSAKCRGRSACGRCWAHPAGGQPQLAPNFCGFARIGRPSPNC